MIRCADYCIVSSRDWAGNAVHRSELEDVAANGVLGADSSRFFCMRRLHAQAPGTLLASWCAYKSRRAKQQKTRSHATPAVRYVTTSVLELALAVREPVDTVDLRYALPGPISIANGIVCISCPRRRCPDACLAQETTFL